MFLASLALVAVTAWLLWNGVMFFTEEFPDVSVLKNRYPVMRYMGRNRPPGVVMLSSRPREWAGLGEIAREAVGAVIVSEDWAFYQHGGYDAGQIKEALKEDLRAGRFVRGASTITQQVVKNVFLERDKNLWRKFKELILAVRLEGKVSKRRILETYLNVAEWGEGLYGITRAARHYFDKQPSDLTPKEGAFLAMLLPSPKKYSESFRAKRLSDFAQKTVESILDKMEQAGYLTGQERIHAGTNRLSFETAVEPVSTAESSSGGNLTGTSPIGENLIR
ncbi:MAG: hypothetical protein A2583_08290 [Bdellovibrionales bacterium RIFOXYD1_FULL_53_11]|nr:MAG: hypothetical protein A2583_08290 [Bdellovibrionales bacterium RIFOXYD1_FULL_53_11]